MLDSYLIALQTGNKRISEEWNHLVTPRLNGSITESVAYAAPPWLVDK